MEYGLIFAEVTAGTFLLGVLGRYGLLNADPRFTAFIAWLVLSSAVLWIVAQKYISQPWYAKLYFACYAASVCLALVMLLPTSGMRLAASLPYLGIGLAVAYGAQPWQRAVEGYGAVLLAWFAVAALTTYQQPADEFHRVKLLGLGFFFLGKFAVKLILVTQSDGSLRWAMLATHAAGLAGVLAFAWMAFSFGGLAPQGGSRIETADTPAELAAASEAAALRVKR